MDLFMNELDKMDKISLTLNCTFLFNANFSQTYCDKKKNDTVTTYYVVTRCCQGYYRASNGSCLCKVL